MRSGYLTTVSTLVLLAASPALADDLPSTSGLPAVSGLNGKAAILGGSFDGDGGALADLSVSLPLGHSFGFQADGLFGYISGDQEGVAAGAGHLFWRDPGIGLLGGYGAIMSIGDEEFYRYAGEAQLYLGQLALEGFLGQDEADLDDGIFWQGIAAYYLSEDLRLSGGVSYSNWRDDELSGPGTVGVLGFEYQASRNEQYGLSLFGEGRSDGDDFNAIWGGVRLYFGDNKSLIRRHREDDPSGLVAGGAGSVDVDMPVPTPAPVFISDSRLKRDIKHIAVLANGLKLYSFKYLWSEMVYIGLMAQDLLTHKTRRNAVVRAPSGFYAVDYSKLGVRMATINEWREKGMAAVVR